MRQIGGKSRCRGRIAAFAAATMVAMAALTGVAFAQGPAVEEYTLRIPDARGKKHLGPNEPRAKPGDLPADVRQGLAGSSEGPLLAEIATARKLGAPPVPAGSGPVAADDDASADGRGFVSAALSTLGDPLALLLIAALIVTGILAWIGARRKRAGI